MANQNFSKHYSFDQSPKEVFDAVCNVRGWWSASLDGKSAKLNDEFRYRHGDIHDTKQKLVEVVPDQKIVWLITDSYLSFPEKHDEWTGTKVIFQITPRSGKTELVFTHDGLDPTVECFDRCSKGWSYYLDNSLVPLVRTGTGNPDK